MALEAGIGILYNQQFGIKLQNWATTFLKLSWIENEWKGSRHPLGSQFGSCDSERGSEDEIISNLKKTKKKRSNGRKKAA